MKIIDFTPFLYFCDSVFSSNVTQEQLNQLFYFIMFDVDVYTQKKWTCYKRPGKLRVSLG